MYEHVGPVVFPSPKGLNINMMPFHLNDVETLPPDLQPYWPLIEQCKASGAQSETVYLSVHESHVEASKSQRRPGIHTEATNTLGWGGGWGGSLRHAGVYMASTDGDCRVWRHVTSRVDHFGGLLDGEPQSVSEKMKPNGLYWMTDKTPHEALPADTDHFRQWFRLVVGKVGAWYTHHNTPNPLGIQPNARLVTSNKFESN